MRQPETFDELVFFAEIKKRPGMFIGRKSLSNLSHFLYGMQWAFGYGNAEKGFALLQEFVVWYQEQVVRDQNGYASAFNHLLYISAGDEELAFDQFFRRFECWLLEKHGMSLPEAK